MEMSKLHCKKYNVNLPEDKDDVCDIDPKHINCDKYKIKKMITDRMLCCEVLSRTYLELALKKSSSSLVEHRQAVQTERERFHILTEDKAYNQITYRETARQLRQQRNRIKSALYDVNSTIENQIFNIKDVWCLYICEERYVENWQSSRAEQNGLQIEKNESELSDAIMCYRKKQDQEQRIHYEMELITDVLQKETLKAVKEVTAQYEQDVEAAEIRIQRVKSDYEDRKTKRRVLEEKLTEREVAINNWLQFKEEHEEIRLRNLKLNKAAVIVQTWWRGLLVRLELGPFKKHKQISRKIHRKKV